jgi:threonine aldolase
LPRIDLVSDTATRPTAEMRAAMAVAPVGDEQRGEDPSVNALTERVAELLGHEAALFLPSGTMCNQIAIAVHCRAGDEIIAAANSHVVGTEGAGAAVFAGSFIYALDCPRGIFGAADVANAVREKSAKSPRSRLVSVEHTSNRGGGSVWPMETLRAVVAEARTHGLLAHMDGARLMNAVVASGISARDFAGQFDSAWLDLSKGLGCPIGGVLVGSRDFIEEANVWKHRFGGAMRQAGIIAAAGLYALDHHVERLAEDHANARLFATLIAELPGVGIDPGEVETNLIFFDVDQSGLSAYDVRERLLEHGVRIGAEDDKRMRAITHLDVDEAGVREAAAALGRVLAEGRA